MASAGTHLGPPLKINNKWRVSRKIGCGSFGDVFLGTCIADGKEVAIKVEPAKRRNPHLLYEAKLMRSLRGMYTHTQSTPTTQI